MQIDYKKENSHPTSGDIKIIIMEKQKDDTETKVALCDEGIMLFNKTSERTCKKSSKMPISQKTLT